MRSMIIRGLAAVLLIISSTQAFGARSAPMPMPQRDPGDEAIMSYNDGIRFRDRAWKLEKEAAATQDAAKRAQLLEKIRKTYTAAIRSQRSAIRNNPQLAQAHAELGYALRKTGDHAAALQSYDRALEIQPNYGEAIEYRAEAYLGLNRVKEAKEAYLLLFNGGAPALAKDLSEAMGRWVVERTADPAGVSADDLAAMKAWVEQRAEVSEHAAPAGSGSWR